MTIKNCILKTLNQDNINIVLSSKDNKHVCKFFAKIVGKKNVGFDNPVYLSEKRSANRNHALAHLMMENNVFPEDTEINTTLEFYFQLCSITRLQSTVVNTPQYYGSLAREKHWTIPS